MVPKVFVNVLSAFFIPRWSYQKSRKIYCLFFVGFYCVSRNNSKSDGKNLKLQKFASVIKAPRYHVSIVWHNSKYCNEHIMCQTILTWYRGAFMTEANFCNLKKNFTQKGVMKPNDHLVRRDLTYNSFCFLDIRILTPPMVWKNLIFCANNSKHNNFHNNTK